MATLRVALVCRILLTVTFDLPRVRRGRDSGLLRVACEIEPMGSSGTKGSAFIAPEVCMAHVHICFRRVALWLIET